ncbi:hypothetical protein [Actinoplanes sp. NPDC049265]|uniref:hypothetical protein n=1 Tax=Actinoplanes sp. NPDC049265 TaxID=3363902 RepID=UPI00371973DC
MSEDAEFRLWFPRWTGSGEATTLAFDVERVGRNLLHKGTDEVCRAFLAAWGLPDVAPRAWRLDRVCTPFFTELPENDSWRDRYRVSWRAELEVGGEPRAVGPGPAEVVAYDATSDDGPGRRPAVEVCEVLAAGADDDVAARLGRRFPDSPLTVHEVTERGHVFRIGRLALGRQNVGLHLDQLDATRDACRELGLVTDIPGFEHLRATVL